MPEFETPDFDEATRMKAAADEPPKDERIWDWLRRRAIERQRGMPLAHDSTDLIREDRDA